MNARCQRIEAALRAAFAEATLIELIDDSEAHLGHAGAQSGKGHFRLRLRWAGFAGMAPLARHRRVFAALAEAMENDIHALSIQALTPAESARTDAGPDSLKA